MSVSVPEPASSSNTLSVSESDVLSSSSVGTSSQFLARGIYTCAGRRGSVKKRRRRDEEDKVKRDEEEKGLKWGMRRGRENVGLRVGDENEEGGYEGRRHLYT